MPKRKSPKRKSSKRSRKRSKGCVMSSRSKYRTRPGPPYPAQDCKNRKMLGNDRFYYKSKPDKNGIYKWIKIKDVSK